MMRKVIVVTGNKYPNGDAGAVRQHVFSKILAEIGYTPVIIGMGATTFFKIDKYDGISYYSLRYPSSSYLFRALGRFLFVNNLKKIINSIEAKEIGAILFVSGDYRTISYLKKYSAKHKIKLVHDSVEWYSSCEFKKGEKDPEYRKNNLLNTKLIDAGFRVIAISTFLEQYFISKGNKTIRVPVILDVEKTPFSCECLSKERIIVYAGNMAGKDQIDKFIQALERVSKRNSTNIKLKIFGITYEQYIKRNGRISETVLGSSVLFFGRVSRDRICEELKNADFTILMRPSEERYAKAGFPTKVVESLATGTPVICNYSSDLKLYLKDGENSIIINECSVDECISKINLIATLTDNEIISMKKAARITAEDKFDWRLYIEKVNSLFND